MVWVKISNANSSGQSVILSFPKSATSSQDLHKLWWTQYYFFYSWTSVNRHITYLLTNLKMLDSLHQDHMKGMHQKSMFFPVLWPPCFHQQWMPLKGYSPPWNNPDWPQTLLFLLCWHWVEPEIHQLATSVVWSAILRSYFLKIVVYIFHRVYKHARGRIFCQTTHNSVLLQIGL